MLRLRHIPANCAADNISNGFYPYGSNIAEEDSTEHYHGPTSLYNRLELLVKSYPYAPPSKIKEFEFHIQVIINNPNKEKLTFIII